MSPRPWMRAHAALFGLVRVLMYSASGALFLDAFGADAFPYVYFGTAFLVPPAGQAIRKLEPRCSFAAYLKTLLGVCLLGNLLIWAGLQGGAGPYAVGFMALFVEVTFLCHSVELWSLAGRLFDLRESKREFAAMGAVELGAYSLGGLLIPALVTWVGTSNLILVMALILAAEWVLVSRLTAEIQKSAKGPSEDPSGTEEEAPDRSYLMLIYAVSAMVSVVFYFADNMFYERLGAQLSSQAEITRFLGVFFAVQGALALLGRFLSGRFLIRFGVGPALYIQPVTVLVGALGVALYRGPAETLFWLVVGLKAAERLTFESGTQASRLVLYQALPPHQRSRVQATALGFVEQAFGGVAGVILAVLIRGFGWGAGDLAWILSLAAGIWLAVVIPGRRLYTQTLARALSGRLLDGAGFELNGRASLELLTSYLESEHPGETVYAIRLLGDLDPQTLHRYTPQLLQHPETAVRRCLLEWLEGWTPQPELLEPLLQDESIQRHVARTLALTTRETPQHYYAYLQDGPEAVSEGFLIGLLKRGDLQDTILAGHKLLELSASESTAHRCRAARVIAGVGNPKFYRPLLPLLSDTDHEVAREALRAAAANPNPMLLSNLLPALESSQRIQTAREAVARIGSPALPALRDWMGTDRWRRAVVAHIGAQMEPEPEVLELLRELSRDPAGSVRYHSVSGLVLNYRKSLSSGEADAWYRQEREQTVTLLSLLKSVESSSLVARALEGELDQTLERILTILGLRYDAETLARARINLRGTPSQKSYALELLDNLLQGEGRQLVLTLVEEMSLEQRLDKLGTRDSLGDPVAYLLEADWEDWLVGSALLAADGRHQAAIEQCCGHSSSLVREAAGSALRRLGLVGAENTGSEEGEAGAFDQFSALGARLQALRSMDLFAAVPESHLAQLALMAEPVEYEKGVTFITEGEWGDCLYLLVTGTVKVHCGEVELARLSDGAIVGEMSVLNLEPRSASITALTPCRLYRLDGEALQTAVYSSGEVGLALLRILTRRVRAMM